MADSETEETAGVLNSLPSTRPGVRSPRRDQAKQKATKADARAPRRTKAEAGPRREAPPAPAPQPQDGSPAPGADELEALAKAGISVAAGAASLGLKLAGRAAGALRGAAPDRPDRDS